jgi:hypothetical protein
LLDLIEIEAEVVLLANRVAANLDPKRFGQSGKWRIARLAGRRWLEAQRPARIE